MNTYVDSVAEFDGATWDGTEVLSDDIGSRNLDLIVRPDSLSDSQNAALDRAIKRAEAKGVTVNVKERP